MRISEVPEHAFFAEVTEVPTKIVYNWEPLLKTIETTGFAVIECDEADLRLNWNGSEENPKVKAFNAWLYSKTKRCIRTKRIGKTRWFVTL